jgi:hypothetical protein
MSTIDRVKKITLPYGKSAVFRYTKNPDQQKSWDNFGEKNKLGSTFSIHERSWLLLDLGDHWLVRPSEHNAFFHSETFVIIDKRDAEVTYE